MKAVGSRARIVFAGVSNFYAEVERRADDKLVGQPILVGGDPGKKGKVQSASRQAQDVGVSVGMTMLEAAELCPDAIVRPTRMDLYREVSSVLVRCLRENLQKLELGSLGEVYSSLPVRAHDVSSWAEEVVRLTWSEVGLPLQLGIAPSKMLARLAAEESGEQGIGWVEAPDVAAFLGPLSLSRLPRVGVKTASRLAEMGARTVGQILQLDTKVVEQELGNHGLAILEMAAGRDRSVIRATRFPKTISRKETLSNPSRDRSPLDACLARLSTALEGSLARHGLKTSRLALRVGLVDETRLTRSETLTVAIGSRFDLERAVQSLLDRCEVSLVTEVRSLGVVAAGLVAISGEKDAQLDLFEA